jgi:hypothetical protein
MKTSELTGAALDWAVAKCEGVPEYILNKPYRATELIEPYSTDWALAGPIIEREMIWLMYGNDLAGTPHWVGKRFDVEGELGPTLLIAAMRCYVASKLSDTVDIPKELM